MDAPPRPDFLPAPAHISPVLPVLWQDYLHALQMLHKASPAALLVTSCAQQSPISAVLVDLKLAWGGQGQLQPFLLVLLTSLCRKGRAHQGGQRTRAWSWVSVLKSKIPLT